MLGSGGINFICAKLCAPSQNKYRKYYFFAGIITNIFILVYFKYTAFFLHIIHIDKTFHDSDLITSTLPVGISFYTFHGISYLVDVYKGKVKSCSKLPDFLMYQTLFPQMIAGPIVRFSEVADQMYNREVNLESFYAGLHRFIVGLSKKILIANQLSLFSDYVFDIQDTNRGLVTAWLGVIAYSLQIFYDFSGYSDMAIGLARMFGFVFPENFNFPYSVSSIREFWRCWHMTLSRFFRDYLYIPLGGDRNSTIVTARNLFTIFLLCGLWHGASINFVIWGLYHGFFLILERLSNPLLKYIPKWLKLLGYPYAWIIILISWVIFRCENILKTLNYLESLGFTFNKHGKTLLLLGFPWEIVNPVFILTLFASVLFLFPFNNNLINKIIALRKFVLINLLESINLISFF